MKYIDTHVHLYSADFDEDRSAVIKRAMAAGVEKFVLPNVDSHTLQPMLDLVNEYPQACFPLLGLHPCSVKEDFEQEMTIVEERLSSGQYKGVGEIGLDYYWDMTYQEQQLEALKVQLSLAKQYSLPVVLHSRDSFGDLIEVIEEYSEGGQLSGVFHCFSGTIEDAKRIKALGNFYMGIGGVVTFKNGGLDKVLPELNLEDIVLETDAPYLAPSPYRGKRNESAYLALIAAKVAEYMGRSIEEVAAFTTENAEKLFSL